MDVYIGLGLLSAGIVVVVFMVFDSWWKNRNTSMAELSGLQGKPTEDPDFTIRGDSHGLNQNFIDNIDVSPSRIVYDYSGEPTHSDLADLCEGTSEARIIQNPLLVDEPVVREPTFSEEMTEEERIPHPQTIEKTNEVLSATHEGNKQNLPPNLLILSVMAKPLSRFESYDLLQAISAAGMQFGEMNIFHYYQATPVGKISLFSLASANKPGDFDLNNIAEFSCTGLMMFMDISQTPDPQSAFKLMMDSAERLVEDLDGVLCTDPKTPWNEKMAWQYHQKIMQFKTMSKYDNKTLV